MKVKIKDLYPNPFRDMENYPINPEKIESLKNSINQTGFWDNILARENGKIIEIAYGHHRLQVLKELYKPGHEVDIPVKELDDSTMIRIMANENDESWGAIPKVIDETVRVTRNFLLKNSQFLHGESGHGKKYEISAKDIAKFLGNNWNESRIYFSLERLGLIATEETHENHLDKEAVEMYPTERSARNFTRAVKTIKNIKPEQQRKVAKRMVEKESFGEEAIKAELLDEKFATKKDKTEKKTIEFEDYIRECARLIEKVNGKLSEIIKLKESFDSDIYSKGLARFGFDAQIEILEQNLSNLLQRGGDKNVRKLQK